LADFDGAQLVIALKEAEHRPMIERRFPELDDRIIYWDMDDVELAPPSEALAMIDDLLEHCSRPYAVLAQSCEDNLGVEPALG
jgi:hypothetical protein